MLAPNAGIPVALRKRATDALASAADMKNEDWADLVGGLLKFFGEEAAEPEHSEDKQNRILSAFREENGREPTEDEMKVIQDEAAQSDPEVRDLVDGKVPKGELEGINAADSKDRLAMDRSLRSFDDNGHMRVQTTNISKANICPYSGKEIPGWDEDTKTHALGLDPDKIYMLFRDPEELRKSVKTWNGKPLLLEHKPSSADEHPVKETIGSVYNVDFEDPYLRASLEVWRQIAIDLIESEEQREISCGYHYDPDFTPGTFNGEPYDGVMRNIRGNHVAIVSEGRAGPDVVVADGVADIQWKILEEALLRAWAA
jgi:hypothetical protein